MTKILIYIQILITGFLVGLFLDVSVPDRTKAHFAYTIEKEIQVGRQIFWVGSIRFSPTKYKSLWLAEVKDDH